MKKNKYILFDIAKTADGNLQSNLHFLRNINALNPHIEILEIGSGQGYLLNHFFQNGYKLTGIDVNKSKIKESKLIYGHLPYFCASGDALPFKGCSFDVIFSFDVFEHIADSDRHLQEVRRVLKPGGLYLQQTPNKWMNFIFEPIRFTKKFGVKNAFRFLEDHCSLHNYWQLKKRFKKNGFEIEFCNTPVVNEYFLLKLKTYIGKPAVSLLNILNPDRLPFFLRPNFYVLARKNTRL